VHNLQVSLELLHIYRELTKYRADATFMSKHGPRRCFHVGGNSSCRQHIRTHYNMYRARCAEGSIKMSDWAIPRPLWREMEEKKKANQSVVRQGNLSDHFERQSVPKTFTREGALEAVAKFIVCDDQVVCVPLVVDVN
jgi:hypothetical protein